jgi:hypothetical protein
MKGGGAQEMMKDALLAEKGGCHNSRKEEDFSISLAGFFFCAWAIEYFDDSDRVALIIRFPFLTSSSNAQD